MQQRLSRAQRVFYAGLLVMLGTSIASAAAGPMDGVLPTMTAVGALAALGGRLWHAHLQRVCRSGPPAAEWAVR